MSENNNTNIKPSSAPTVEAKKKAEQFVDKLSDTSVELKSPLPPRFQWRGINYVAKDLTSAQLKVFAEDKAFPHIVPKS